MCSNRNFYACQTFFKEGKEKMVDFGKTVFVFKSQQDRDNFLTDKNELEYFKVTQKEAYKLTGLTKKGSVAVVRKHSQFTKLFVLSNIRECWGSQHVSLKDYNNSTVYA